MCSLVHKGSPVSSRCGSTQNPALRTHLHSRCCWQHIGICLHGSWCSGPSPQCKQSLLKQDTRSLVCPCCNICSRVPDKLPHNTCFLARKGNPEHSRCGNKLIPVLHTHPHSRYFRQHTRSMPHASWCRGPASCCSEFGPNRSCRVCAMPSGKRHHSSTLPLNMSQDSSFRLPPPLPMQGQQPMT